MYNFIVLTEIGSKTISDVEKLIPDYNFHYAFPTKKTNVEELGFTHVIH